MHKLCVPDMTLYAYIYNYLPSIATDSKCSTCEDQFTKSTVSSELLPNVLDSPSTITEPNNEAEFEIETSLKVDLESIQKID